MFRLKVSRETESSEQGPKDQATLVEDDLPMIMHAPIRCMLISVWSPITRCDNLLETLRRAIRWCRGCLIAMSSPPIQSALQFFHFVRHCRCQIMMFRWIFKYVVEA